MIKLNLETKTNEETLVKDYLQENVSETLANKINNGVQIKKDNKTLLSKKTLSGFWNYAYDKAKEQAKGNNSIAIRDDEVFGWAIHYFEEDTIEELLLNLDGTPYEKPKQSTPISKPAPVKTKPQLSFFDKIENNTEPSNNTEDDDVTEEDLNEAFAELEKEEKPKPQKNSPIYETYSALASKHSNSVIAYRLGDFYEVFGEKAVKLSNILNLTLTGRDCGAVGRIPMIGFPYHIADKYFQQISKYYSILIYDNEKETIIDKDNNTIIDVNTGEIVSSTESKEIQTLRNVLGNVFEVKL